MFFWVTTPWKHLRFVTVERLAPMPPFHVTNHDLYTPKTDSRIEWKIFENS